MGAMASDTRRDKLRRLERSSFICLLLLVPFSSAGSEWKCSSPESNCKTIYIVHDSWHAAIILRARDISPVTMPEIADFPAAEFIEFSWGDRDYFPDPQAGVLTALKAAFWSSGSVLHVVGFGAEVKSSYPNAVVTELGLTAPSFDQLTDFISRAFLRSRSSERAQPSAGLFPHSRFYLSTHKFSLLKTCNTWVAEALASAGLPVAPGQVFTAANLQSQIAGLGQTQ